MAMLLNPITLPQIKSMGRDNTKEAPFSRPTKATSAPAFVGILFRAFILVYLM